MRALVAAAGLILFNSTANRFNPDPTATVRWGDQTWEEMMLGYYGTIELPGSTATRNRPR